MPAGLFLFILMSYPLHTSSKLSRVGVVLAIIIITLLLDGFIVAWLWGTGVDFAIMDRVLPGESGFNIKPLPNRYKWLLSAVFIANIVLLFYFLTKRKRLYALSFAVGAFIPIIYLILILASA